MSIDPSTLFSGLPETTISALGANAVDEASDTITYVGFCLPGTIEYTEEKWAIMKVEVSGNITTMKWAGGNKARNKKYSERASLTYKW